mmetsp:Transcript_8437/g.19139  ORF Transcript_8437/g.19139 Transcript_8437/m.19139 type:complete len:392 (-) Transcript_8437:114-1289(-)
MSLAEKVADTTHGKVHVPWGADGSGKYTLATKGCFDVIANCWDLLEKACAEIPLPENNKPFIIADLGTADGGTSMPTLRRVIDAIRKRDPSRQILVCYEDQPNNDFKSLFFYTQGLLKTGVAGVKPLLEGYDNVFVLASGTGFYNQCFPDNYVHLMLCCTAMHWLSKQPCTIKGHMHHTSHAVDAKTKAAFAAQAKLDWDQIMSCRARELAPGGRFVIANFCVDAEGQLLGKHNDLKHSMYDMKYVLWQEMATEGLITQEEVDRTTFYNYYRSVDEHMDTFSEGGAAHALGLRVKRGETRVVPCPYRAAWMAKRGAQAGTPEALEYARGMVPTMRTWSNSTYTSALNEERSAEEKGKLVDELFERLAKKTAAEPTEIAMPYCHWYADITKE